LIERILPSCAVGVEAFVDLPGESAFPGEEHLIANAVESRRREFITARRCAREALSRLGFPPVALHPGSGREPQWPSGAIGSITHCAGYRASTVARAADLNSIGIDAEPHLPLPRGVREAVTVPAELGPLSRLAQEEPAVHWDRLLFSAKESIYKAWYPLTRRWLGFEEARLSFDPVARTFTGHILVDGSRRDGGSPLTELHGRYLIERDLIVTAVTIPRPAPAR
jgi:4'-phosphopantetheinyl transferase EntD